MKLLENKIVFLTGGSMGIGYECAHKYRQEGAKVVVISNHEASLRRTMETLGDEHMGILCDVSKAEDVESALHEVMKRYGKLDIIHNNAGIAQPSKVLHDTTDEEWSHVFEVNVKGIYLTTKYGIEALKKSKGCILNTSSLVGQIGQENHAAYSATKGAINALTKSMAIDYAAYSIRVNAVAPAGVWTPMLRAWCVEQTNGAEREEYLNHIHVLGYCPEADVIADACVFLLSENARFITGHILPVSGGAELGYRR